MTQDDGREPWWDGDSTSNDLTSSDVTTSDATTRVVRRAAETPTQSRTASGATTADAGAARSVPRRRPSWFVPVALLLAAVLSFGVVTLVVRQAHHGASSRAASVSAPASPTASSGAAAAFPADSSTACMENEAEVVNEASDLVRMKQGTQTSCAFLTATRSEVLAHLTTDADAAFTVRPYSVSTGDYVALTCRRDGAFTYCEGGRQAKIWVRNP